MDFTLPARVLALVLAATLTSPATDRAPATWSALDAGTAAALDAAADDRLEEQRAGAFEELAPLTEADQAALALAQGSAPELADQRGGDVHLTDREVQIILWTAAVIAVIFIVA